ncbi:MAG: dipeptidase PepE [Chitinophagaceae bacterium]
MSTRILVFSSSRVANGGYLEAAAPVIKTFLGENPITIAFIPFAGVTISFEDYAAKVRTALAHLGHEVVTVLPENAKAILAKADAIMVGGGNTFKLLAEIYKAQVLDFIRDKVSSGTPYIGWSAGSNITGPTICTTNDMPIVEPKSFNALGLFPFQLNPHYFNYNIPGHNGETRDDRLTEFLIENPGLSIACLPEGTALLFENKALRMIGEYPATLLEMEAGIGIMIRKEIASGDDISWLL